MPTPVYPGEHAELQRQESADGHSFQQGDKVKCLLEVDILRQMQEGHGGWNPKMAEVLESSLLPERNTTQFNTMKSLHIVCSLSFRQTWPHSQNTHASRIWHT